MDEKSMMAKLRAERDNWMKESERTVVKNRLDTFDIDRNRRQKRWERKKTHSTRY